jgi:hypothetical protein
MARSVKTLFANDIHRRIEKSSRSIRPTRILRDEINSTSPTTPSVTTPVSLKPRTPNKPHEGIAIWISILWFRQISFAKMLSCPFQSPCGGESAADRFAESHWRQETRVLLKAIGEDSNPCRVSTCRRIAVSVAATKPDRNHVRAIPPEPGLRQDLDLSELEIDLEEKGQLTRFGGYQRLFNKDWNQERQVAFALSEASRVLNSATEDVPMADSWVKPSKTKPTLRLASSLSANELMKRRRPEERVCRRRS